MQFSNLTAFVAVLSLASGITAWETLPDGTVVATDIEYTQTVHEPCLFPHTQDRRAVGDACTYLADKSGHYKSGKCSWTDGSKSHMRCWSSA